MPEVAVRELTFAQAIREALAEEMRRDERVCILGEDVAEAGTPFKVLSGLVEEFGTSRVIDTPISEAGFTGIGVGAAMTGMRPVVDIMFGDFLTLTMDQLVNQAAKVHYMSGGKWKVPMVLRTTLGATRRSAAQHSQSLHAWLSHVPGLKVVMPSTPYDAKGLLKSAIRDENPVIFFEDKMMYRQKGPVPTEEYTVPLGVADVKRPGKDITFVATSSMVEVALGAAALLETIGISAEVVDPRTTWPLDEKTLVDSAKKTSKAIVIDEGYGRYGVTGELASVIAEGAFYNLEAPVKRMGAMHVPIPFSPPLEDATVPTAQTVFEAAREGAASRLRAILMTAFAMVFGMIPMAIGFSEGGAQTAPLGRAVIGGLILSTFATLTVLPSIYAILQGRASVRSLSLNPLDPGSPYYDGN